MAYYVVLKFRTGILSFVLLVTFLGAAIELVLLPLFPSGVFSVQIAGWEVAESITATTPRMVAVPAGAVLVDDVDSVIANEEGVGEEITPTTTTKRQTY